MWYEWVLIPISFLDSLSLTFPFNIGVELALSFKIISSLCNHLILTSAISNQHQPSSAEVYISCDPCIIITYHSKASWKLNIILVEEGEGQMTAIQHIPIEKRLLRYRISFS